jgi:hypothetical protein
MALHRQLSCSAVVIALATPTAACNPILGIESVDPAPPDAAPDARKPVPITLSQTSSSAITHGIGCEDSSNFTLENSFYRRFRLADYGATGAFLVKGLAFGVYSAQSNQTTKVQPLRLLVYEDTNPDSVELTRAQLRLHREALVMIPDTAMPANLRLEFTTPFEVPPGSLVAELRIESQAMRVLRIGVNIQGESASSYRRAPNCQQPEPAPLDSDPDYQGAALVLSVTGEG